ncbi:ilv2p [Saccharomyces arboricola H-6]|uniref:Acetolactate synthase n=1 Tax=Saccharomyces arboricola (strain H-6 / AS 2.3317 / CBS 10644) TaxID=1160507 RepID=J8Q3H2_SACAR|nr:ilv2p [Saccharomyces arboricola H-6]
MIRQSTLKNFAIKRCFQQIAHRNTPAMRSVALAQRFYSSSSRYYSASPLPASKRPEPAPSFNIDPLEQTSEPSKLAKKLRTEPDMDTSFVGLTGGQIFNEMMSRQNVDTVFGYPGGAILPVYDAIHNSDKFNFVLPRHEQGAGHMAEGYARASGKPGVVLVTSGPGATNVVTPMADALADGIPMVVFTGQVPTSAIGTDAFQEADVVGISRSCTKWNVMVKSVEELPLRINEAFEIATSGRPGPVLVDLPKDVTAAILRNPIPTKTTLPSSALNQLTSHAQDEYVMQNISKAADLINLAKKPVLYVGAGMLNHVDGPRLLKELSDRAQIPVTTSLQGLGAFDQEDPKSLDMLGMHGCATANFAVQNADLLIAVGARFDDRVTCNIAKFAPEARRAAAEGRGGIIHFEVSPKNINKVVETQIAVEGDATANLDKMMPKIFPVKERSEWFGQINKWKKDYPYAYMKETPGSKIKPQTVISKLSKVASETGRHVIVTTGVGQHQMWAAQHWTWKTPRTFITSGGLGTMGYGLPAAIGAQVAKPDSLVIDIDGDASFNMTLTELSSAVQAGAPVKILVLNNEEQGMVTQWQSLFYEHRYSHTHQLNPDFIKLAEAMGLKGIRVKKQEELDAKLKEFVSTKGPVLLEVEVDKKVPVLPMVPAGKGLDEFISFDPEVERQQTELRHKRTGGKY